tara:strand:- start:5275 stop:5796 length:522 start_codon:yes stop_codon:yes gene_type:complete
MKPTILKSKKIFDERGYFSEVFKKSDLKKFNLDFIQDNLSFSKKRGTLRGLHFQIPPFEQAKLVRVLRGSILDVVVDLRTKEDTYLKVTSVELSSDNWNQFFVPAGFAHGFITKEDNTEVLYKVNNYYNQSHDSGIFWNDADLGIDWGTSFENTIVSEKDMLLQPLKDFASPF